MAIEYFDQIYISIDIHGIFVFKGNDMHFQIIINLIMIIK